MVNRRFLRLYLILIGRGLHAADQGIYMAGRQLGNAAPKRRRLTGKLGAPEWQNPARTWAEDRGPRHDPTGKHPTALF